MSPCHTSTHAQLFAILFFIALITGIQCSSLCFTLAVAVAASSSSTSGKVAVVHVVSIAHEGVANGTERFHGRQTDAIAVVCTITHVGVGLYTVAGTALGGELQYEVVVAVIHSRHAAQVALLVVGLHLVYDVRRQILHHGIVVSRHEIAAIHLELPHLLAIDGDFSVVVNLSARQHLHQCLDDRAFRHTEGISVVDHSVVLDHHLRNISRNDSLTQLDGVNIHHHVAQSQSPVVCLVH